MIRRYPRWVWLVIGILIIGLLCMGLPFLLIKGVWEDFFGPRPLLILPRAGYFVAFSPNGQLLISAQPEESLYLWRVQDGTLLQTIASEMAKREQITFSTSGIWLAEAGVPGISIYQVQSNQLSKWIHLNADDHGRTEAITFSFDGQTLLSWSTERALQRWRVADGQLLETIPIHVERATAAVFSQDTHLLATCSPEEGRIQVWRVSDGTLMYTLQQEPFSLCTMAFSPNGHYLTGGVRGTMFWLWRMSDGQLIQAFDTATSPAGSLAFSPDGQVIAAGSYHNIELWQISDSRRFKRFDWRTEGTEIVYGLAFSPDGRLLASGSSDLKIRLWQVK